jgi:membrane protease YdiL (CAAX protease family)
MNPALPEVRASTGLSPRRLAPVFALMFIVYQLPEGLGMRTLGSVPVMAALMLMTLPFDWLCGRWLGFRGLDAWYLGLSRGWAALLAGSFALALLVNVAAICIGAQLGVYRWGGFTVTVGAALWAALAMLPYTFIPSVAEDILTRGFLMRAFPGLSARWIFIVVSAALYTANHIFHYADGPAQLTRLFCFGLAYAAGLYYSRTLWAAVGLHWGWNFAGQFFDRIAAIDVLDRAHSPLVSSAAHLAMLAAIVAFAAFVGREREEAAGGRRGAGTA